MSRCFINKARFGCFQEAIQKSIITCTRYSSITQTRQLSTRKSSAKDLYAVLDVSPFATQSQIKDSYYKLSMKYHPDQNQGRTDAELLFKNLNDAYSVLSKPSSRQNYDKGLLKDYPVPHHVKVMKHRRAAASTSTTKKPHRIYNFEEFDRGHYGDILKRQSYERRRRKAQQQHDEEQMVRRITHQSTHMYVVPAILMAVLFIFSKKLLK